MLPAALLIVVVVVVPVAGSWWLGARPDMSGMPISADASKLVLAARDVSPDYDLNRSKTGGTELPCLIDDMSADGRVKGYESTLNPSAHNGFVRGLAYEYIDEHHALMAFRRLIATLRSGIDPTVCVLNSRLDAPVTVVEADVGYPAGSWLFYTTGASPNSSSQWPSDLHGAIWRHLNIVEKVEMMPGNLADLALLVGRQDGKIASAS